MNGSKNKKYRINYLRLIFVLILFVALIAGIVAFITTIISSINKNKNADDDTPKSIVYKEYSFDDSSQEAQDAIAPISGTFAEFTDDTFDFGTEIYSEYGVLVDLQTNTVIAQRNAEERMYPASLTKIMTLIVAVENTEDINDTFVMTNEIIAPLAQLHASVAGFAEGEECSIKDLLHGMILPSGADASIALATYIAGSEEAFVEMMNDKAKDLGLENTHFVNTSGLHDDNHYSTAYEFSVILRYAMENELCRQVLSEFKYTTASTEQHPEGIELTSDLFARMYGDEADGFTIYGGKTGFTDQAGHCLATFAENNDTGDEYLLILCRACGSKWYPVYDTELIYEYLNAVDASAEESSSQSAETSAE